MNLIKIGQLKYLAFLLPLLFFMIALVYWLSNFLTSNFHVVIPGQLYRSAQLTPQELADVVREHHIRSIINLRGIHPADRWYRDELIVAKRYALQHSDVALHPHVLPSRETLRELVGILQGAPPPILVHCREGADRTGLVAAMGVIVLGEPRPTLARRQVTWYYNVLSSTTVGYQLLRNYFAWLKRVHRPYGKASFLEWMHSRVRLKPYHGIFLS